MIAFVSGVFSLFASLISLLHSEDPSQRVKTKTFTGDMLIGIKAYVLAFLLLWRIPEVSGQNHFSKSCFAVLKRNDADGNGELDPNEYTAFLVDLTRGIARAPVPGDLVKVFMASADPATQTIPMRGLMEGADPQSVAATTKLCSHVNYVIRSLLKVAIPGDQCMSALMAADTEAPKGQISNYPEYPALLAKLTGTPLQISNFDELSFLTKAAYDDMAIDGVVTGSAGTQYLIEFCARALTAFRLDGIADKMNPPEPAPQDESVTEDSKEGPESSQESSTSETIDTGNSTTTNATHVSPTDSLNETVAEVVVEVEMSDVFYERCKSSMLFIDKDRDNQLNLKEFGALVDRLKKESDDGLGYREAKDFYDARFEDRFRKSGKDPSIMGSKPAQIPSDEDIANLKFVCQSTSQAMNDATVEPKDVGGVSATMMKQTITKNAPIDAAYFSACRRSMYIADSDRNSGMDVDEFVDFVERLSPTPTELHLSSFGDLDEELQAVYKAFTTYIRNNNEFMINVSGSKPASHATDEEMSHMEGLCQEMNDLLLPVEE